MGNRRAEGARGVRTATMMVGCSSTLSRRASVVAAIVAVLVLLVPTAGHSAGWPSPAPPAPLPGATPIRAISGHGHAGLYGWGATTLLDGSVLIGDYWNFRIVRYAADGTPLGTWFSNPGSAPGHMGAPYGMATDPTTGDVYVSDTDAHRID